MLIFVWGRAIVSFQHSLIMRKAVWVILVFKLQSRKKEHHVGHRKSQPIYHHFKQKWLWAWAIITHSTYSTVTHLTLTLQSAAAKQQGHQFWSAFPSPLNISQPWRQDRQRTACHTVGKPQLLIALWHAIRHPSEQQTTLPSGTVTQGVKTAYLLWKTLLLA